MTSIGKEYTDGDSDDGSLSMSALEEIWDQSYVHPHIIAIDARFRIRDCIRQAQCEWKGEKLSEKRVGKGLYKVFKAVVNELKNSFPTLGESGSEV